MIPRQSCYAKRLHNRAVEGECSLIRECKVITGRMMRLAITGRVLNPQGFKGDIA